jgi:four helix bundle protein
MAHHEDDHLLPFQKLDIYRVARELVQRVTDAKIRDNELRDQATRAAKSTFLRLCEGLPHNGVAMRRKYFRESQGSLHETVGAMDAARVLGVVSAADARAAQELGFRLRGMLHGLMRCKPSTSSVVVAT